MRKPAEIRSEGLGEIATLSLEFGRLLMEAGSSGRHVDESIAKVAVGLGAERVDVRVGYASLAVTLGLESDVVTRMSRVGPLGVNESLRHALSTATARIGQGGLGVMEARSELNRLVKDSPRYPDLLVALTVGIACAAFGRLLSVDWAGVAPIFLAAALGQMVRRQLARSNINVFISATAVAFLGAVLCGFGARLAGSQMVATAMIATVLLLVPGVPAFNAGYDILAGRPTLGSARAVWVMVMLMFMTVGVWLAQGLLAEGR